MATEEVMTYRAFCEHGKVRALMTDPLTGSHSPAYADDAYRELRKWNKWAAKVDRVNVEEARKSDMACDVCDAPRLKRKKSINQATMAF